MHSQPDNRTYSEDDRKCQLLSNGVHPVDPQKGCTDHFRGMFTFTVVVRGAMKIRGVSLLRPSGLSSLHLAHFRDTRAS